MASDSTLTVQSLDLSLNELVHWERVALHLPEMSQSTIDKIKRDNSSIDNQKQALYGTWLQLYPGATWGNVIHALETVGENSLARKVNVGVIRLAKNGSKTLPEKPVQIVKGANPVYESTLVTVEESVVNHLKELHEIFLALLDDVEEHCEQAVTRQLISLSQLTRALSRLENIFGINGIKKVQSVAELFELLNCSCTFLDCDLLEIVVKKIPNHNDLLKRTECHLESIASFKQIAPIETLQNILENNIMYSNCSQIKIFHS